MNKPRVPSKLREDVPPLLGFSITKYFPGHGLYHGKVRAYFDRPPPPPPPLRCISACSMEYYPWKCPGNW